MALPTGLAGHVLAAEAIQEITPRVDTDRETPPESCFAETLCSLKDRVRWNTAAWSPSYCRLIAHGVLASAKKYDLPPVLLLAVMLNESDLDEKAVGTTLHAGRIYAKDSGLMGIRCVVDQRGRCGNGNVRGIYWKDLMNPLTNIESGAKELASWRDGGGVSKITIRVRTGDGHLITKTKNVPCQHKTHAYWAHYNHGPRYIDKGSARHYPHRVAVLYYALAKSMNLDVSRLESTHLTVHDPGSRIRTADRPVEPRYRKLCDQIHASAGACAGFATLAAPTRLQ